MSKPLDYFYETAGIIARSFVSHLPNGIDIDDVIQDLVIDLWDKLKGNKFSTEDEAWVICQHHLFNMFREWEAERKRADKARDEYDDWQRIRDIGDVLDHLFDLKFVAVPVRVTEQEIANAARVYSTHLKDLRRHRYSRLTERQIRDGFLFIDGVMTPRFLARLTKALMVLGTTPDMVEKVISTGLRCIRNGYSMTDEDSMLLRNYRRRVGRGIKWQRLPGGDVILRRGRFKLYLERA